MIAFFAQGTATRRGKPRSETAIVRGGADVSGLTPPTDDSRPLHDSEVFVQPIVVSQFFHVSRAKMQFKKAGIAEVETASPKLFSVFEFVPLWREWPAYYVHLLGLKTQ